jgi:hypothetical protein
MYWGNWGSLFICSSGGREVRCKRRSKVSAEVDFVSARIQTCQFTSLLQVFKFIWKNFPASPCIYHLEDTGMSTSESIATH